MSKGKNCGVVGLIGLTMLGAVACGSSATPGPPAVPSQSAPARPSLPPRPVELRLDGVDPCALVTAAQRTRLGVNQGQPARGSNSSELRGDSCVWSNIPASPDNVWSGRLVLGQGAEYALGREPLRTVDGFAATTTGSTGSDPAYYCLMLVDVAPGQSLIASYDNGARDYPGMNHQLACDKAQRLASDMLSTLRSIKQR